MNETTQALAAQLQDAFESGDRALLEPLLHPGVRWGGEEETEQTCHNRAQVLDWYGNLHDAGVRARVSEVLALDQAVVLGLTLTGPDRGPDGSRPDRVWQVFRLADDLVADIRGYPQRDQALTVAGTALPARP
jgi:hypothetical protein